MLRAKRPLSDSECDDVFDDCKDGETGEYGVQRKRRRGVIEKRRRDRINTSLTELRRLVPTAFEKQGSAKLEKAEILQMTVDHLKLLHAKGLDALAYDPNKFAMDYHSIGFRECAAEVARYLVTVEGMDIQDPLRLRLMSHLQCYSAQRELANKQHSSGWGFQSYSTGAGMSAGGDQGYAPAALSAHCAVPPSGVGDHSAMMRYNMAPASMGSVMPQYATVNASGFGTPVQSTTPYGISSQPQLSVPTSNHNTSKPYRPWGTELAY